LVVFDAGSWLGLCNELAKADAMRSIACRRMMQSSVQAQFRLAHSKEVQAIFLGRPADIGQLPSVGHESFDIVG
jgi:hypothetical protein